MSKQTPTPDGGPAFCSKCDEPYVIKQGNQKLCAMHYRFGQMRTNAKRKGKTAPTHDDLSKMVPENMVCQVCKRTMNWRQKDGASTVASLQHDRSGEMRIICLSCNVRHASFSEDEFYSHDQSKRKCPRCCELKELNEFQKDNSSRWLNTRTYCRKCTTEMHSEYIEKNRKKYNEKTREYYHKRKNSGNPIKRYG